MPESVSKEILAAFGAPHLVYVREVLARDAFPEGEGIEGFEVDPDAVLYAVHAADGTCLAVTDDRETAYEAARDHDLSPVSVH